MSTYSSHIRNLLMNEGFHVEKLSDGLWHLLDGEETLLSNRSLGDLLIESSNALGIK